MKVYVVMGNDYLDAVFTSKVGAEQYCDAMKIRDTTERPTARPIYWRSYEFELRDQQCSVSYPYLALSRRLGMSYAKVLQVVDYLENESPVDQDLESMFTSEERLEIMNTMFQEHTRRSFVQRGEQPEEKRS